MTLPWLHPTWRVRLASASARRAELLRQVGIAAEICPVNLDETVHPGEQPHAYVARMAREKGARALGPGADLVIAADTAVILGETILGKPADAAAAVAMLQGLSGRKHLVLSGVAVYRPDGDLRERVVATGVWFKTLTPEEIAAYVASGEPMDKAGAYGIQGLGAFMVARVEGSYSGVVGLPLCETLTLMTELIAPDRKSPLAEQSR
ncbi:MAG: septum formation inhibitor Maf [Magnetococcales bacterium]|nr:septum formation inhibitor Maf [Magnetococcales bacterium]